MIPLFPLCRAVTRLTELIDECCNYHLSMNHIEAADMESILGVHKPAGGVEAPYTHMYRHILNLMHVLVCNVFKLPCLYLHFYINT